MVTCKKAKASAARVRATQSGKPVTISDRSGCFRRTRRGSVLDTQIRRAFKRSELYLAAGMGRDAVQALQRAQPHATGPDRIVVLHQLLQAHLACSDLDAACMAGCALSRELLAQGLRAAQVLPWSAAEIALSLVKLGENEAALGLLDALSAQPPADAQALVAAASAQRLLQRHAQALALLQQARHLQPDDAMLRYHLAVQLHFCGDLEQAAALLLQLADAGQANGRALLLLARLAGQVPEATLERVLAEASNRSDLADEDQAALAFTRFNLHERRGDFTAAWTDLQQANARTRRRLPYARALDATLVQRMQTLDQGLPRPDAAVAALAGGPQPVFIVSLPRSGSTFLERMISNHPQVAAGGELTDFSKQLRRLTNVPGASALEPAMLDRMGALDWRLLGARYLQQTRYLAQGKRYFTDKQPLNHWFIGAIVRALPHARIIVLQRARSEVCFSIYRAMFGDSYEYAYDIADIAHYHAGFQQLMRHWQDSYADRLLGVDYESLLRDREAGLRRICAFLDLDYDPRCASPESNATPVATLSSAQVRSAGYRPPQPAAVRYPQFVQAFEQACGNS